MHRTLRFVAVLAVFAMLVTACASDTGTEGGGGGGGGGEKPGAGTKVCLVSDEGGFDDKSFNQLGKEGIEQAEQSLGIQGILLESKNAQDYAPNIQSCLTQGSDLVITQGFKLGEDTQKAAEANPDTPFAIIDFAYDPPISNVQGLTFQTDQAAFLAGYLAAGMTQTNKVGTFGGINIPTVTIFMDGFAAGIMAYNKDNGTDVQLLGWDPSNPKGGTFSGDFTNQDNGRQIAQDFIQEGVDIIMPVAGPVGLGAAAAAQDAGNVKLVWVDTDGCVSAPEYCSLFLTSVQKQIAVAEQTVIKEVVDGTFKGGQNYLGTLENGGVGIAPYHEFDSQVPQELRDKIDELKQGIIDGSVSVDPKDYQ